MRALANTRQGTAIIALTRNGAALAVRLRQALGDARLYVEERFADEAESACTTFRLPVRPVVERAFADHARLVLFLPVGAAVRLVAPLLRDKASDPAVVAVDDAGWFAVSLLSGHRGGADALAQEVANALSALPVVTSGSHVMDLPALDLLGQEFGWQVEASREALTRASAALLNGEPVGVYQEAGEPGWCAEGEPLPQNMAVYPTLEALATAHPAAALVITDRLLDPAQAGLPPSTVFYRPRSLAVGLGCRRGVPADELEAFVRSLFEAQGLSLKSIRCLATAELKQHEPGVGELARRLGVPARFYSVSELNSRPGPSGPSAAVRLGAAGVAEPAALLAAGATDLLVPKQKTAKATLAVARATFQPVASRPEERAERSGSGGLRSQGSVAVVGLGPGDTRHMTQAARQAVAASDAVVGYKGYVEQVLGLLAGKQVVAMEMGQELDRARRALELAGEGKRVALVSGGDAGVYGMAGPLFQALEEVSAEVADVPVEVVPGVSALNAAAALLGAPLVQDFAAVSLSDLQVPWEIIARRLEAAASADYVLVLYNPRSSRRQWQLEEAVKMLLAHRAPGTPVGVVRNAYRQGQRVALTNLAHLLEQEVDMFTTVIVGNSSTSVVRGRMVTPRGYDVKGGL